MVVYSEGASLDAARQAVTGRRRHDRVGEHRRGVATVRTTNANFLGAVSAQSASYGATSNRPVGYQAPLSVAKPDDAVDAASRECCREQQRRIASTSGQGRRTAGRMPGDPRTRSRACSGTWR